MVDAREERPHGPALVDRRGQRHRTDRGTARLVLARHREREAKRILRQRELREDWRVLDLYGHDLRGSRRDGHDDELRRRGSARGGEHDIVLPATRERSEEHTSELQSRGHLVCRLLLEKKKNKNNTYVYAENKKRTHTQ